MALGKIRQASLYLNDSINSLVRLVKGADFFKGVVLVTAILTVLITSLFFNQLETGISLTMGMFISAPANVPGSSRHRFYGILSAIFLGMLATITVNLAAFSMWLLIPVLAMLIFLVSLVSVYGFRASMVSFSGLLAIILSFAHPQSGTDIFRHAGLIGLGGLWYLLFSYFSNLLVYKSQTLLHMAEAMEHTAEYLKTRGLLALERGDKQELESRLFGLQADINAKHEILREILLSTRRRSGQSNFSRRQVLVFIELVDILELAIGHLPNLQKIRKSFGNHPQIIGRFTDLLFEMAEQLTHYAKTIGKKQPPVQNNRIEDLLQTAGKSIGKYRHEDDPELALLLHNTHSYFIKLAQKIAVIQKVMANLSEKDQVWFSQKDSMKFISQQDYDWDTLRNNLSFKSPIFRHSLRLTLTVLVGYGIGHLFSLQNFYWVLLTIIVIMRPGYALTKERSKHRLVGTLIGGAIAVGVVLVTQNTYIYAALAIITFVLAFSLVQKNYRSSAIFITLNIVFVYALMKPEAENIIQFRVLDTLTGAGLAFIANLFFWPSWEFLRIQEFISKAIQANKQYLTEIARYYQHKDNKDPAYKLSRKEAFLAIGNLSAAFQRMTQEPKLRQNKTEKIYELVVLNHTFLSLAASLGTYMRHHKTTKASLHFENYISSINRNLELSLKMLNQKEIAKDPSPENIRKAQDYLDLKYRQLAEQQAAKNTEKEAFDPTKNPELQEVKLIADQLNWMFTLSENLIKTVQALD